jgi:hypothetical protein
MLIGIVVGCRRLTHSQRRNFRATREALERRQLKVKAKSTGAKSAADLRSDMRHRPLSPGRAADSDPFAALLKTRGSSSAAVASLGRRAVMEFKIRQAAERRAQEALASSATLPSDWDFAPPDAPVHVDESERRLPAFQAAERSPRSLLNPADRMVGAYMPIMPVLWFAIWKTINGQLQSSDWLLILSCCRKYWRMQRHWRRCRDHS